MISPADALQSQVGSELESNSTRLHRFIKEYVPPDVQDAFVALGADEVSELKYIEDHDLAKIGMPPIKKSRPT